jgi:hypothetical protein
MESDILTLTHSFSYRNMSRGCIAFCCLVSPTLIRSVGDGISVRVDAHHSFVHVPIGQRCEQALTWICKCQEHHWLCPKSQPEPPLPPMVLDVSPRSGSTKLKLHVKEQGETARYAALSYCWGGPQRITTTTTNLAEFTQGMAEDALPKTIVC